MTAPARTHPTAHKDARIPHSITGRFVAPAGSTTVME
jgi:hypothetical protein